MGIEIIIGILAGVVVLFLFVAWVASRFRRCPSDRILVVYGKVGGGKSGMSARCYHGGAAFIMPVIQDYAFLDLTPLTIDIKLEGALSLQNIRVNTPSTFTVGISTEPGVMQNAAERLLGMEMKQVAELARDIIFGQMRVVLATMPIEEINADRDKLIENITSGVEGELRKVGLRLINVNIQDITDESGYIDALGKEAAARAINEARVQVAEKDRDGAIGSANAHRDQRVQVASAEATAVEGENEAKITVANSNAKRREMEAEAERQAAAAEKVKSAQALQEAYAAEEQAERERAKREEATQRANVLVPAEIKKSEIETLAEAEAERVRRTKKGEADGLRFNMQAQADGTLFQKKAEADGTKLQLEAEADGLRAKMLAEAEGLIEVLGNKAEGFRRIVESVAGDSRQAALLLVTEQLPQLVAEQVKAISNLEIDKVTVWEGGGGNGDGKTATANFLSGLVGALPPLHELTKNVGVDLPEYLGRMDDDEDDGGDDGGGATGGGGQGRRGSGGGTGRGSRARSAGRQRRRSGAAASSGDDGEDAAEPPPAAATESIPEAAVTPVAAAEPAPAPDAETPPAVTSPRSLTPAPAYGAPSLADGTEPLVTAELPEEPVAEPVPEEEAPKAEAKREPKEMPAKRQARKSKGKAKSEARSEPKSEPTSEPRAAGGKPPSLPGEPSVMARSRVRAAIAADRAILRQLDFNRDSRIQREEVETAVDAAFDWARRALADQGAWYYVQSGEAQGPTAWDVVNRLGDNQPDLPVNCDGASFWLPYAAVADAANELRS